MLTTAAEKNFFGKNDLSVENGPHGPCLRSTPRISATALYQAVQLGAEALQNVRWMWKVDALHVSADIRKLEREDFGAKIMFVFGEPSLFDKNIPTLAYVWTATPVANGALLQSKRFPSLYYIQLRGRADVGRWRNEKRNIAQDYRDVFGHEPGPVKYIAVFNDNDHTGEPASAVFSLITSQH